MSDKLPFYEWSKENTKQIRVSKECYGILKTQASKQNTKMMHIITKLIKKEYGK